MRHALHQPALPGARAVVALAATIILAACGTGGTGEDEPEPAVETGGQEPETPSEDSGAAGEGVAVPEFTAETVDGDTFDSAELAGEPTVYWFWAPWCTVCFGEAGGVADAAEEFAGQANFVGVAGLGEVDQMRGFVADTGIEGFPHVVDADGSVWESFGVVAQPAFAFVDTEGGTEVVAGTLAAEDLAERVEALSDRT